MKRRRPIGLSGCRDNSGIRGQATFALNAAGQYRRSEAHPGAISDGQRRSEIRYWLDYARRRRHMAVLRLPTDPIPEN